MGSFAESATLLTGFTSAMLAIGHYYMKRHLGKLEGLDKAVNNKESYGENRTLYELTLDMSRQIEGVRNDVRDLREDFVDYKNFNESRFDPE